MLPVDVWEWDDKWTALYVERSAIMEIDGCLPRRVADFKAQLCIRRMEENDGETMRQLQARSKPGRQTLPARWAERLPKDVENRQRIPELIK